MKLSSTINSEKFTFQKFDFDDLIAVTGSLTDSDIAESVSQASDNEDKDEELFVVELLVSAEIKATVNTLWTFIKKSCNTRRQYIHCFDYYWK